MAVPPLAEIPISVEFETAPPSTPTGPPEVSPTPIALPALPPLFTSPRETAPPLALAVATPPFPELATSVVLVSPARKSLTNPISIPLRIFHWNRSPCGIGARARLRRNPSGPIANYHRSPLLSMVGPH